MFKRLRNFAADTQGAAVIEGALIFPFLAILSLGAYEFSNAIYAHHLMTTGIRDAARYLARTDDPAANLSAAQNIATTGQIEAGGARRVSWWAPSSVTATVTTIPNPVVDPDTGERRYRGPATIRTVEVRTSVTFQGLGSLNVIGLDNLSFNVTHTERVIGE